MRFLITMILVAIPAAGAVWLAPAMPGVSVSEEKPGAFRVVSAVEREYTLETAAQLPATPGEAFEVNLSVRVGLNTRALPELACYDASGKEIPAPSSLATGPDFSTTNW